MAVPCDPSSSGRRVQALKDPLVALALFKNLFPRDSSEELRGMPFEISVRSFMIKLR